MCDSKATKEEIETKMQLRVWFFRDWNLFTHVLLFKLFLSGFSRSVNIQKLLLFIEDNNEREMYLVGKTSESEWRGKLITVPDNIKRKSKGRQEWKKYTTM
jgi:hypothetical protein